MNISLIEDRKPLLGVVLAPALRRLFAGAQGVGAIVDGAQGRLPIHRRRVPANGLTVVSSRSHGDTSALDSCLAGLSVASLVNVYLSLKLCLIAGGEGDVYTRLGRTMEWDIAAGHAVVSDAGERVNGRVKTLAGDDDLRHDKAGFDNPHLVAAGSE